MILSQNKKKLVETEFGEQFCFIQEFKEARDQVDFLYVDKQSFLQVDIIVFGVDCEAFPKYPK